MSREVAYQLRAAAYRAAGLVEDIDAAQRAIDGDEHLARGIELILEDARALQRRTDRLLRVVELMA